jgi:hypothetical protein
MTDQCLGDITGVVGSYVTPRHSLNLLETLSLCGTLFTLYGALMISTIREDLVTEVGDDTRTLWAHGRLSW